MCGVRAQNARQSETIGHIAERLAASDDDPALAMLYTERLAELAEQPVELSDSSEAGLSRLFFLTGFQVRSLSRHIGSSGPVLSEAELASIPGFDAPTVEMMLPFCSFSTGLLRPARERHSSSLLINLSERLSGKDTAMNGSPLRLLAKLRINAGNLWMGITSEKDPGERILSPYPDFVSGYISFSGRKVIKEVVAGDYSLRFGQGLALNSSFRPGLSLSSAGFLSQGKFLRPYTSTDESNFFRGLAASASAGHFEFSLFASANGTDASTIIGADSSEISISSFYTQGYHRTVSELAKKDVANVVDLGAAILFSAGNSQLGLLAARTAFTVPVKKDQNQAGNAFAFSGSVNNLLSFSYTSVLRQVFLFGELSVSEMKKTALVQGATMRPSDRLTFNLLYRNYASGYFAFHGNGPGSGNKTGEQGLTGSFNFEAARHLFVSAGCDVVSYPWLRYRNSAPSREWKSEIRLLYEPTERTRFDLSFTKKMDMNDRQAGDPFPEQGEDISAAVRMSVRYVVNENFRISLRGDYKVLNRDQSKGMLVLWDGSYRFGSFPLTLWYRYCIFRTEDWNSRIYTYENDIAWSYSIPALYGEGSRSYIMASLKIFRRGELRIRYASTVSCSLSGETKKADEVKCQLRLNF